MGNVILEQNGKEMVIDFPDGKVTLHTPNEKEAVFHMDQPVTIKSISGGDDGLKYTKSP